MTCGSLFSGIGGFDLGLARAGFELRWEVEIDPFCQRVLAKHWPQIPRFTDIKDVGVECLEPVDLIAWGFPCQDVSIAGRRKGLVGQRSGLFLEGLRILAELRPAWTLIENVPGLFSQHYGTDFAAVLSGLESVGYVGAWRTLDSRWFGLPQRRARIFFVGHLGDRARAEAVLFESARGGWDSPTSEEARAGVAYCLAASAGGVGGGRQGLGQGWNTTYIHALSAARSGQRFDPHGEDCVMAGVGVRRLTPLECEKLQGFPPGWTCLCDCDPYSTVACTCPDSPRYRALGNAVAVSVAEWIGRRLVAA